MSAMGGGVTLVTLASDEWWLMVEAKRRNPDVKLYGLSWAVAGWV